MSPTCAAPAIALLVLSVTALLDPSRAQLPEVVTTVEAATDEPDPGPATEAATEPGPATTTEPLPVDRAPVPLVGVTPGPGDLPLHTWQRAEAAWKRQQQEMLADEEMAEALAEHQRLLRPRRHPSSSSSWSGRPQLSERQAAALLAEEIEQQEGDDDEPVIDAPPAPKMRRPVKRLRAKKIRRPEPELPVVPQPHMLDGLPSTSTTTTTTPASVTRVRRQQGADRGDGDPTDQAVDESRVKRHGHMGSTGPVHSFVKTDKHGHYKWGVRHHVGHHFA